MQDILHPFLVLVFVPSDLCFHTRCSTSNHIMLRQSFALLSVFSNGRANTKKGHKTRVKAEAGANKKTRRIIRWKTASIAGNNISVVKHSLKRFDLSEVPFGGN